MLIVLNNISISNEYNLYLKGELCPRTIRKLEQCPLTSFIEKRSEITLSKWTLKINFI